ncbi:MAG: hypothetical protein K2Y22_06035 [Candidatus Obscuribacterales bacterium]|nr:hypothetical protein [Candidatus Obscuribacterales bacterium]
MFELFKRSRLRNRLRRYFWNKKFIETTAYAGLLALSIKLGKGEFDSTAMIASLTLSGAWLALTALELRVLLRTYYDTLSRILIWIPLLIGAILSGLALYHGASDVFRYTAVAELIGWFYVYMQYRHNRNLYVDRKHGPLPAGTLVNAEARLIRPGDMILTSGRVSKRVRQNVGHGEIAYLNADGEMWSFSSYMEKGVIRQPLEQVLAKVIADGEHYIVLRLVEPWTPEQIVRASHIVEQMYADNVVWRNEETIRRRKFADSIPLPQKLRDAIYAKIEPTGYDWFGLFIGVLHSNRFTCIGACVELDKRLGVAMNDYGTGLLGWGTGLLDPIVPMRLLGEPAYRLLTVDDQEVAS